MADEKKELKDEELGQVAGGLVPHSSKGTMMRNSATPLGNDSQDSLQRIYELSPKAPDSTVKESNCGNLVGVWPTW